MTDFNLNQATGRTVELKILKLLRALGRYIAKADYDHRQIARLNSMEDHRLEDMGLRRTSDGRVVRR